MSVLTADGATVQIRLPRPGGLRGLSQDELLDRAHRLAQAALQNAVASLGATDIRAVASDPLAAI